MTTIDTRQHSLFPLPEPRDYALTPPQRWVLDWLVLAEDRPPVPFPDDLSREALRNLIGKGLVRVTGWSPGRYRITEVGRIARTKGYAVQHLP